MQDKVIKECDQRCYFFSSHDRHHVTNLDLKNVNGGGPYNCYHFKVLDLHRNTQNCIESLAVTQQNKFRFRVEFQVTNLMQNM